MLLQIIAELRWYIVVLSFNCFILNILVPNNYDKILKNSCLPGLTHNYDRHGGIRQTKDYDRETSLNYKCLID